MVSGEPSGQWNGKNQDQDIGRISENNEQQTGSEKFVDFVRLRASFIKYAVSVDQF
jgi:hypothetical protein